jgi:hypothetical protein
MRARHAAIALGVLLASARAAAEPAPTPQLVQTVEPRLLCKPPAPTSDCIELHPGRFLDEQSWLTIDVDHKRLQDALTRSDAENKSLRESAKDWRPGWVTLTSTLLTGIAVGVYLAR